jgi:hypothetical protein
MARKPLDDEGAKRLIVGMLAVTGLDLIRKPRKKPEDECTRRSNQRSAEEFIASDRFEDFCDALHIRADIIRKYPERLAEIQTRLYSA